MGVLLLAVLTLKNLLLVTISSILMLRDGWPLECPSRWGEGNWTTLKYVNSCITFVPYKRVEYCEHEADGKQLPYGKKFTQECIETYCDDNFPVGYFWSPVPLESKEDMKEAEKLDADSWLFAMHGVAYLCNASTHRCITERTNRSLAIQGSYSNVYPPAFSVQTSGSGDKSRCDNFGASAFASVPLAYLCHRINIDRQSHRFTLEAVYPCHDVSKGTVICGHEGKYPCERKRKRGCSFNNQNNGCFSYYFDNGPPGREKYQRCERLDYGAPCNCSCSENYSGWTSWSHTCNPLTRMRIAPYIQAEGASESVNCSLESLYGCCISVETLSAPEKSKCADGTFGRNVSLLKSKCSLPGSKMINYRNGYSECVCGELYRGTFCEKSVVYCKEDTCGLHGDCRNLTSGDIECDCHSGYVGVFCDYNIYVIILPFCICAAVLGGMLILRMYRKYRKHARLFRKSGKSAATTTTSSRTSSSRRRDPGRIGIQKPSDQITKKPRSHDYVLPTYTSDQSQPGAADAKKQ